MSFIVSPGVITPPLTAGGVAYANGSNVLVTEAGTARGVLVSGGTSAPSFGSEVGSSTFTANGSISNGAPVIVDAGGTVSQVAATAVSFSVGTVASTGSSAGLSRVCAVYHSTNNKIVYIYKDSSSSILVGFVGTISGTTITWSASQTIAAAGLDNNYVTACYVSTTDRIYITYMRAFNNPEVSIVSLTGTTLSVVGTSTSFVFINVQEQMSCSYDVANNRIVVIASNPTSIDYFTFTPAVSSITYVGSGTVIGAQTSTAKRAVKVIYDSTNQKSVFFWRQDSNGYGGSKVFDVGTSTLGSTTYWLSASFGTNWDVAFDSTNSKVVICFADSSVAGGPQSFIVGTVSGTSITYGTKVANAVNSTYNYSVSFNSNLGIIGFGFTNLSSQARFQTVTVSGTSGSFGTEQALMGSTSNICDNFIGFSNVYFVGFFDNNSGSYLNRGAIIQPAYTSYNLTSENFLGFSKGTYTAGQSAIIDTAGAFNTGQSGLTTAETYYVQNTGGIGLTASTPSVVAGTAVSSTKIVVKG
jgi:hypothetical protein